MYKKSALLVMVIILSMFFITSCKKKSPTEQTATGTVGGFVYKPDTHTPISSVIVSIGSKSYTTGTRGYYELIDIPLGSNTITANADTGYTSYSQTITVYEGYNQHNVYLAAPFPILPEMVFVPAGEFQMGDNFREGSPNELPVHTVYLDAYYIGKYEVTNEQFCAFLNEMGKHSEGDTTWLDINSSSCLIVYSGVDYSPKPDKEYHPVVEVSWYGARAYCTWLTNKTGHTYRLPTEAEWEKAARGTNQRRYAWGDSIDGSYANYIDSGDPYDNGTTPVGYYNGRKYDSFDTHRNSSPYGAYDMAGNAWEWCHDWYSSNYYANSPPNNPVGPSTGSNRVVRGGGWASHSGYPFPAFLRSAGRSYYYPDGTESSIGFRCLREY